MSDPKATDDSEPRENPAPPNDTYTEEEEEEVRKRLEDLGYI